MTPTSSSLDYAPDDSDYDVIPLLCLLLIYAAELCFSMRTGQCKHHGPFNMGASTDPYLTVWRLVLLTL